MCYIRWGTQKYALIGENVRYKHTVTHLYIDLAPFISEHYQIRRVPSVSQRKRFCLQFELIFRLVEILHKLSCHSELSVLYRVALTNDR